MKIRKLTFGKYRGQYVLYIIASHIGYIMWCLENLQWFSLTEEEQIFYDWQAIAIKKYKLSMTFPVETLYKHVKDRESLSALRTPYKFDATGNPSLPKGTIIDSQLRKAGVYTGEKTVGESRGIGDLYELDKFAWKADAIMRYEYPVEMKELDDMETDPYSIVT